MNGDKPKVNQPTLKFEKRSDNCCMVDMTIDSITVYLDKAEITRSVKYEICEGQILECVFEQLPSSIDKDSIRVEVQNNAASILDVTFVTKPTNENSDHNDRLKKIRETLKMETQALESIEAKKARLLKQKNVLDTFANTLIEANENHNIAGSVDNQVGETFKEKVLPQIDVYNPLHLETINNFFQLYNDSGEKFDDGLLEIEDKIKQIQNHLESLKIEKTEIEIRQDEQLYRELYISMEGRINGEFEIYISYVVKNCGWRPVYDVRVSNNNGVKQINYYGMVKQASGEDWYQPSKFTLSTSEPGIGGTVPEIGLQRIQFKTTTEVLNDLPNPTYLSPIVPSTNLKRSPSKFSSFRKSRPTSINEMDISGFETSPAVLNKEMKKEPEIVYNYDNQPTSPTCFNSVSFDVIRPPVLVTCDNNEYRVMISVINLDPHYQHITVPRLSQFAYLRTICVNTSKFTLLAGPANVYIDSSFIGKTDLKTTSPCEEFVCNLGADRGVKVSYLPMIKYKENRGKTICVTFKQEIQVINNHERPIKILVLDQIPVSTDDRIKISLAEPYIKHPEKYDKTKPVRMNFNRQIEWDCDIGSKNKKEMVLKFSIEHPTGKDVEILQIK